MFQLPEPHSGDQSSGAPAAGPLNSGAMNWSAPIPVPSTLTGAVSALVSAFGSRSGALAVTRTESVCVMWASSGTKVAPSAPGIGTPSSSHWYSRVTSSGSHAPGSAVSVWPTYGVPVIDGGVTFSTGFSAQSTALLIRTPLMTLLGAAGSNASPTTAIEGWPMVMSTSPSFGPGVVTMPCRSSWVAHPSA